MADEESVVSSVSSPTATENLKRKFEDLDAPASDDSAVPEVLTVHESLKNEADEEENGDGKRQRMGSMDDETDVAVCQNGHQEDGNSVDQKDGESGGQENEKSVELKVEGIEQIETAVDDKQIITAVDDKQLVLEPQEPMGESLKIDTKEPDNNDDKLLETESVEVLKHSKNEFEKSSDELYDQGNVQSNEVQPALGTEITSSQMEVPNDKVGVLIGKAGDTIRSLQDNSGAKIQIMKDADTDPQSTTRPLELVGTLESIARAEKLIRDVIAEADAGGSPSLIARGFNVVQAAGGGEQLELQVPIEKVGLIIGKGGETIRNLQTRSGARIQLIQQNQGEGNQSRDRTVRVSGNKRQIGMATDMIKDVMNQIWPYLSHPNLRSSVFSSGYGQHNSRGPLGSQWGSRGSHQGQFSSYDYPQRAPQYHQNSHLHPTYGNYPQQQGPRSNFGSTWEQRPPQSMHGSSHQGNYNYGQQRGPDYGHPPSYSQTPHQSYGTGYNEVKYDQHTSSQHYGNMGSQPMPYTQVGGHSGYGPQDQYGKPPMYGMQQQVPHSYGPPRSNHPGTMPHQGNVASAQSYGQNTLPQQSYPYGSSGQMQQGYPAYGTDGYSQPISATPSTAYPSQAGQPSTAYVQPGAQQPAAYPQPGSTGGYGSYPTAQPSSYTDQTAVNSSGYGYQAVAADATYAQPTQAQTSYDQSAAYGSAPVAATYGKSASPQAAYQQYDSTQAYAAHR